MTHRFHFFNVFLLLIAFCALGIPMRSLAQNSTNYLQYNNNTALTFNLNTTSLLENAQTISDAFCLHLEAASNTAHIYAKATASTNTTTPMPVSNLELAYYSTNSTNYSSLTTSDIPLSGTNQLLFIQAKVSTAFNFCYSVKMPAVGYTYAPGTYTFTITFTMTEP